MKYTIRKFNSSSTFNGGFFLFRLSLNTKECNRLFDDRYAHIRTVNSPKMKKSTLFALLMLSASSFAQTSGNEIEDISAKRELASYEVMVSPNPSADDVFINAPEGSICRIVSAAGTYVGTWEVRGNGIDLNDLGMGTYIAVITLKGQSIRRRFVIL